jgi:hypothetical protein
MNFKKIFRELPDKNIFLKFLKDICVVESNNYLFYDELYKKNKVIIDKYFFELKNNYLVSKYNYILDINFNKCITVLKQICKLNNITYDSTRKYYNNTYKIYYKFKLNNNE